MRSAGAGSKCTSVRCCARGCEYWCSRPRVVYLYCCGLGFLLTTGVAFSGFFFFSSRRRHTRLVSDWSSDVCSSDLEDRAAYHAAACIASYHLVALLGLAEQSDQVVGGDTGGGVVGGPVLVGHREPSTAEVVDERTDEGIAGEGEPGTPEALGAHRRVGQGDQGMDGGRAGVGCEDVEVQGACQVSDDGRG